MKKIVLMIGFLVSTSSFAACLDINASAQGTDTCRKAVELFADLVLGQNNSSIRIKAKKLIRGACDGETCNPNTQDFKITYELRDNRGTLNISTVGPDSADRCHITRH